MKHTVYTIIRYQICEGISSEINKTKHQCISRDTGYKLGGDRERGKKEKGKQSLQIVA